MIKIFQKIKERLTGIRDSDEVIPLSNSDRIADDLEDITSLVIEQAHVLVPAPSEYSVFQVPDIDTRWVVVIFFKSPEDLRMAISEGICYEIHELLNTRIDQAYSSGRLERSILFEYGNSPSESSEIENFVIKTVSKLKDLSLDQKDPCSICGHPFDDHQLRGFPDEKTGLTTEGWMVCPDDDCHCFRTWNLSETQQNSQ